MAPKGSSAEFNDSGYNYSFQQVGPLVRFSYLVTVGVDVYVTLADLLKETSSVHSLLLRFTSVVPTSRYILDLFLLTAVEHLSAVVSTLSIVHLSPVVALEHLSTAVSLPSVVRLSVLAALGHFLTSVSTPLMVLKEVRIEGGRSFQFIVPQNKKRRPPSLTLTVREVKIHLLKLRHSKGKFLSI